MNTIQSLTIGALSEQTAVKIETIRFYERLGILPAPPRSTGGHRLYSKDHKQRLTFIRRARELGFSLNEIRALLGLDDGRRTTCAKAKIITELHIADIRRRIKELKRLECALSKMVARCPPGNETPDCPIIDALALDAPCR